MRRLVGALTAVLMLTVVPAPGAGAARGTTRDVQARDSVFSPVTISIRTGTRIRWTNTGRLVHTTTSNQSLWDDTMAPGETFVRRFSSPGSFAYRCTIHRDMTGTITVTT